jgi:hypothetical protein
MLEQLSGRRKGLLFGLGCVGVALVCVGLLMRHEQTPSASETTNNGASLTAVEAPSRSVFAPGADQDDLEGYDGQQWGSTNTEDHHPDGEQSSPDPILEKIIGPPGQIENASFLPDTETAPKIQTFQKTPGSDDTSYGFYKGQFAWVSVRMNGDYSDVKNVLDQKYQVTGNISRDFFGDAQPSPAVWDGYNFTGTVYRRGKTNTRIYLLMSSDQDGNQNGLWVIYIPTSYVSQMRQAWWSTYEQAQLAKDDVQKEAADNTRKVDQEKIQ